MPCIRVGGGITTPTDESLSLFSFVPQRQPPVLVATVTTVVHDKIVCIQIVRQVQVQNASFMVVFCLSDRLSHGVLLTLVLLKGIKSI